MSNALTTAQESSAEAHARYVIEGCNAYIAALGTGDKIPDPITYEEEEDETESFNALPGETTFAMVAPMPLEGG